MYRKKIYIILLSLIVTGVFAQKYVPASNGLDDYYKLLASELQGTSASPVALSYPYSHLSNPALNAGMQRIHLGVNYSGMISEDGYHGHIATLGVGIPTKIGNFTSSAHFITSDFQTLSYGIGGTIHTSFSKAITDQFHFGFGLSGGYLQKNGMDDWMLALDIGATYTFEFVQIPYVRIGGALRNLGKWMQPIGSEGAFPAPFSLAFGVEAGLIETDAFFFALRSNVEVPGFQNLRWDIGLTADIFQIVEISSSWQLDLLGLIDDQRSRNSYIPSFNISVHFPLQKVNLSRKSEKNIDKGAELITSASVFPTVDSIWVAGGDAVIAFGAIDRQGPIISYELSQKSRNVSPNNDGVQDILSFDFAIDDESILDSYMIAIKDQSGETVKTIQNTRDRLDSTEIAGFFKRLFEADQGISVPKVISWDGRTDGGTIAADGTYSLEIHAYDKNKNNSVLDAGEIYIDSTTPELAVELTSSRVFSPNGDGNLDTVAFSQVGSTEMYWNGRILDANGNEQNAFEWNNASPPSEFVWDGLKTDGELVPDGIYQYELVGRDEAGNERMQTIENIIVQTDETPLSLRISHAAFSPNDDGVQDVLTILPIIGNPRGINNWRFMVSDSASLEPVYEIEGDDVPSQITFDGNSTTGAALADGSYFASLQLFYVFGNQPEVISPPFQIDTVRPEVTAQSDTTVISPNGDGVQDTFIAMVTGSTEQLWFTEIRNEDNEAVLTEEWRGTLPSQLTWDARNVEGRIVPDGQYRLHVYTTDRAGNSTEISHVAVQVDTTESDIIVSPEFLSFSPNGDGVQDTIRLFTTLTNFSDETVSYEFAIRTTDGTLVSVEEGNRRLPTSFRWDGSNQNNQLADNTEYIARLAVQLPNGNRAEAASVPFTLDTMAPELQASLLYSVFSPDGDGVKDSIPVFMQSSREREWLFEVRDATDVVYTEHISDAALDDRVWNGKDSEGNSIPDGEYSIRITSTDAAGNTTEEIFDAVRIRTTNPIAFLVVESDQASPNDDGFEDDIPIEITISSNAGLEQWKLSIHDEAGKNIKELTGDAYSQAITYRWDGKNDAGTLVEGVFTAEFSALYDHGPQPMVESRPFRIDVSAPRVALDVHPVPVSPDNDGVDDTLFMGIDVEDISPIAEWNFSIFDRNDDLFQVFSGVGSPTEQLQWDGRGLDGSIVVSAEDYPYLFTISDALNNTASIEGIIPVDVLVIRDGDTLRIQISAINFEPNSSVLVLDSTAQGRKNNAVLDRLVTIFKKYASYRIKVEGHAVNITGTEREEVEELLPLSTARAVAVMNELDARGIRLNRIEADGLGGSEPLVPHTDKQNRWKNRRVEFILLER